LEHIPDDTQTAMNEFVPILNTGGWGFFQIPQDLCGAEPRGYSITDQKETAKFGQIEHVRLYTEGIILKNLDPRFK